jgi:hypothetical protein
VGNGDELHDLRRDVRLAWWREHGVQVEGCRIEAVAQTLAGGAPR